MVEAGLRSIRAGGRIFAESKNGLASNPPTQIALIINNHNLIL
jgi:hypothetical protein